MSEEALTPMLKQYFEVKSQIGDKDTILFFRLGDFYEMFFEDAVTASSILEITLTSRNRNDPNPVPLCGIPYHAADGYIAKLIQSGKKVAICEQVEDPKLAKGVVRREIVKIVTPGVILEPANLDSKENNYLVAITPIGDVKLGGSFALAIADISTGDFRVTVLENARQLADELAKIEAREVLVPRSFKEDASFETFSNVFKGCLLTTLDDPQFDAAAVMDVLGAEKVKETMPASLSAAGAIRNYLNYTKLGETVSWRGLDLYNVQQYMVVDEATKRNLELTQTLFEGNRFGTLLWLLDQTATSMGARLLRQWIFYPLLDVEKIELRLDAVEVLKNNVELQGTLRALLKDVHDIERLTARIVTGNANGRDLVALKDSLKNLPVIRRQLNNFKGLLNAIYDGVDESADIAEDISSVLVDEPPLSIREGEIIRRGYSAELDELHGISCGAKNYIASLESREKERTGIGSLKVGYNKVFGYYIEVTNTHKEKVPLDFIRKQTLTNAERYITPELKEYEEKVLGADERVRAMEYEYFCQLRTRLSASADRFRKTAQHLAMLDVLLSLGVIAAKQSYCRPVLSAGRDLKIKDGRHPIIESMNPTERFVPNDLIVNTRDQRLLIITGPNMAGKSTVMRQAALIVLMAQMGSFVPAIEAEIGLVDRIFTRVGASDNLMRGQSTFMVEMTEAANILRHATDRSFIIIDEIGRGTSTFDGVSIAWAMAEYLHDQIKARTLFATHYHELTDLTATKSGVKNYNIAVREWNNQIVFLRKLVPGGVNRSYGIQVARLAGLPEKVLNRATEILENLETGELNEVGVPNIARSKGETATTTAGQLNLFHQPAAAEVMEVIKATDVTTITPIEAMNLLHDLKQRLG